MNIICFHNPDEENGYLSNWYLSKFSIDGISYSSAEQYMMYQKAKLFEDEKIAQDILFTSDVAKIKALGRKVSNFDSKTWIESREQIVFNGLLAKFTQNEELKNKLMSTDDAVLAECAVKDKIWGIGLSMHDPNRFDMHKWNGSNLLGKTLMSVRETLSPTDTLYMELINGG